MSIKWNTNEGILSSNYEGESINEIISYEISVADGNKPRVSIISNSLPNDLTYVINDGFISITGRLPSVTETETYYITIRLEEIDRNNKIIDLSDRYFEIKCLSAPIKWDESQEIFFEVLEYTDVNIQLKLKNTNGNEVFKKISGDLPTEVSLYPNGIISGPVYTDDIKNSPYVFKVEIQENGKKIESLGEKEFTLNVIKAMNDSKPIWITEKGNIGSINNGEKSEINILGYDISGTSTISYILNNNLENGELSKLPTGLSLNSLTGKIEGTLNTTLIDDWVFSVTAQKYYADSYISSEPREFIITTNPIQNEHKIHWQSEETIDLGEYSIGTDVLCNIPKPITEDGSEIKFSFVSGNLPKDLKVNSDGLINGTLNIQPTGVYEFDIKATTQYTYSIKHCKISIKKGLGKNSIKTYLRLNLEYKDQYNNIKTQLNESKLYKQNVSTYVTPAFPVIDVATLTCFDREVLSYILDFGNPEIVRFGHTKSKIFSQVDNNGDVSENYEVFYKEIDESTYDWRGNIYNLQNYEDFNNEIYDIDKNALQNIILEDGSSVLIDNHADPRIVYDVFNFKNVRNKLSQKIYVYKKIGSYEYDFGSQEIINDMGIYHPIKITDPWCFDRNKILNSLFVELTDKKDEES